MFFMGLCWWIHNCTFFHPFAEQPQWSCLVLVALGSVASGKQSSAGYIGYDLPEGSSDRHQTRIDICDSQKTQITWTCVVSGHRKTSHDRLFWGRAKGEGLFFVFFKDSFKKEQPFLTASCIHRLHRFVTWVFTKPCTLSCCPGENWASTELCYI